MTNAMWAAAKWVMGFVAGVMAVTLLGLVGSHLGWLVLDDPVQIAYRWGIGEAQDDHLLIRPPGVAGFRAMLTCDRSADRFTSEVHVQVNDRLFFRYVAGSESEPPVAQYIVKSGDSEIEWLDSNGDGWFEEEANSCGRKARFGHSR